MKVAIFGGSFDPPHVGHVLAVAYASSTHDFDQAIVVPVFVHPFDKPLAPFEHRVAMARLAFAPLARTSVSTVEATLGVPSLTIRTLEHLSREHPEWTLHLVVGSDVLRESSKWTEWDRIELFAQLVVLGRVNAEHPFAPAPVIPNVSSSQVRSLLAERTRDGGARDELSRLVPRSVLRYVDEHGLYG
jgi:nicotinate-nucleotide adenylyltransferase